MPRLLFALVLLALSAPAQEKEVRRAPPKRGPVLLQVRLRRGQRFTGSNTVSFTTTTSIKQGDREQTTTQSVERTERYVDKVLRSGARGVLEIERTYLKLFTKARTSKDGRPDVYQSPLQGRTVLLKERNRRREMKTDTPGASVDQLVRRTVGMELDWRDIFSEDPVKPGDEWEGDAGALAKRLGAYLNCGSRTKMRVRFEEVVEREGARLAKLYVDWRLEGMRDRNLFTKTMLAGDVYFDLVLARVVAVDLVGNIIVRGAVIQGGVPRIIRGTGQVVVKSTVKLLEVEASAPATPPEK